MCIRDRTLPFYAGSTISFDNRWKIVANDPVLRSLNYRFKRMMFGALWIIFFIDLVLRSFEIVQRLFIFPLLYYRWMVISNELLSRWLNDRFNFFLIIDPRPRPTIVEQVSSILFYDRWTIVLTLQSYYRWVIIWNEPFYNRWTILFNVFTIIGARPLPTIIEQSFQPSCFIIDEG